MNVPKKAILTVIAVFSIALLAVILLSQTVVMACFEALEKSDTETPN